MAGGSRGRGRLNGPGERPGASGPRWLLRHRVTVPAAPARYCARPELLKRCAPASRPITLLAAPGGFGKTTLLAACCREAAAARLPVAWLTLSQEDDCAALDAYLAFALQRAGVDVLAGARAAGAAFGAPFPRTAASIRRLQHRSRPCLLALDELERVSDPESVALLNFLLENAPACLHLAMAYRVLPRGLDAARGLDGGCFLTAEDLRFSRAEIGRFFDLSLSRRELTAVAEDSRGWAMALQIRRNRTAGPSADPTLAPRDVVQNWIAGRFWQGFTDDDRDLVLDAGLLEWFDAALLEEATQRPGALPDLIRMPLLAGLLEAAGEPGIHRLHPLLREHCAGVRRRQSPARARAVHCRVAAALARRGETVAAMRHAIDGADPALAGRILLEAGGVQWWLRAGFDQLAAANRYLTDAALAHPRLAMVRSMALLIAGRFAEADRAFAAASALPAPRDPGFEIDRLVVHGTLGLVGVRRFDATAIQAAFADISRFAAAPGTRDVVRGAMAYGQSAHHGHYAEFDTAAALGRQARKLVVGRSTFLTLVVDSLLGQIAMARGRVREARARYRSAHRIARGRLLEDPRLAAYSELLIHELALERNRVQDYPNPGQVVRSVYSGAANFGHYAAALDLATELAFDAGGANAALAVLEAMAERAHTTGLTTFDPHLATVRVSLLADAGRVGEAERAWRGAALPVKDAGCLDLQRFGWRGVEACGCARVRLHLARGEYAEAARLERALAGTAAERGLQRTLMRALALRVRVSHRAGGPGAAREAASDYVGHYMQTDYARPLLRAGGAATAALERYLDAEPQRPLAAAAARLLAAAKGRSAARVPHLERRETEVLRRLATCRDKEIAAALGLTVHGVRYHVRKIFRKLEVGSRHEAARRAAALGLLESAE